MKYIKFIFNVIFILIVLPTISISSLYSQDLTQDLKLVSNKYKSISQFELNIKVNVYETNIAKSPEFSMNCIIAKNEDSYYLKQDEDEYYYNSSNLITIDNSRKIIAYSKRTKDVQLESTPTNVINTLDSNTKFITDIHFNDNNNLKTYTISYTNFYFKTIIISINKESNLIEKLTYYYNDKYFKDYNKVDIIYSNKLQVSGNNLLKLSEDYFVSKKGRNISASLNFKNYQVIQ